MTACPFAGPVGSHTDHDLRSSPSVLLYGNRLDTAIVGRDVDRPHAMRTGMAAFLAERYIVGAGGMGTAYRARDTRLDRAVAIKMVHAPFTRRFEREARAFSALNHPRICMLDDVGEFEGAGCLVLELVDGRPLRGPLPWSEAARHVTDVCDALAAAHGRCGVGQFPGPLGVRATRAAGRASATSSAATSPLAIAATMY